MKTAEPWAKGSMTFTDNWAKPPKMPMRTWLKEKEGRTWVSKRGELPSEFFARVLRDLESDGAQITDCLLEELQKEKKSGCKGDMHNWTCDCGSMSGVSRSWD